MQASNVNNTYLVLLLNHPSAQKPDGVLLGYVAQAPSPKLAFEEACIKGICQKDPRVVYKFWPHWEVTCIVDKTGKSLDWSVAAKEHSKLGVAVQNRVDKGDWTPINSKHLHSHPHTFIAGQSHFYTDKELEGVTDPREHKKFEKKEDTKVVVVAEKKADKGGTRPKDKPVTFRVVWED